MAEHSMGEHHSDGHSVDEPSLERAVRLLDARIHPYVVYLFGSAARSEQLRPDSDIDLAFLSDTPLSSYDTFMLAQELADLLRRDVDLVNLGQASTVFAAQIITTGRTLKDSEPNRWIEFQIRTLKEYTLLNEERAVILERIKERGSLYGQ